jgi:hypothetical protein
MKIIDNYMDIAANGMRAITPVSDAIFIVAAILGIASLLVCIFPFFLIGLVVGKRDTP